MDGPERLETGPVRRSRARRWVAGGVAALVVVGIGAVRLAEPTPDPSPSVPITTPAADPHAWPGGLPSGTLYALDETGVLVIDASSGFADRAALDVGGTSPQLTAFSGGVLVWSAAGHRRTRWVRDGGTGALDVGGLVAKAREFRPGNGSVWISASDTTTSRASTWRLVDELDAVASHASLDAHGDVLGDGSGGLFDVTDAEVRHVVPGSPTRVWKGAVFAVGPDGYETLACRGDVCRVVLRDRVSGTEQPVARPVSGDLGLGAIAPGNRFVATIEPLPTGADDEPSVVRVAEVGSDKVLRSIPAPDEQEVMTWLSDRWLVAGSRDGLVLYDAVADRVVTPDLGLGTLSGLVFEPA